MRYPVDVRVNSRKAPLAIFSCGFPDLPMEAWGAIWLRALFIALSAATSLLFPDCSHAIEFTQIEAAWREREESSKTVAVEWTEQRISQILEPGSTSWREIVQLLPDMRMYIAGTNIRFEDVFVGDVPEKAGPRIDAYNGSEYRRLAYYDGQHKQEPQGLIAREITGGFTSTATAMPLLLFFRGTKGDLDESALSEFRDSKIEIDDDGDATLRAKAKVVGGIESEWILKVRPSLDFAPIQLLQIVDGVAALDIRLEFNHASNSGFHLKGWKILMLRPNGELLMSSIAKVTSCKINESIDVELFKLQFPPGTIVEDYRNVATVTEMPRWYLVLADGEREILPAELRKGNTRERLARTKPGESIAYISHRRNWLFIAVINIAIIIILVILVVVRMISRRTG